MTPRISLLSSSTCRVSPPSPRPTGTILPHDSPRNSPRSPAGSSQPKTDWSSPSGTPCFSRLRIPLARLQRSTRSSTPPTRPTGIRCCAVGIHFGPVVQTHGDIYGTTVNVAARLAAAAAPGQTLATRALATAAETAGIPVTDLGPRILRNMNHPQVIFAIGLDSDCHCGQIDPVCRMRLPPQTAVTTRIDDSVQYRFCSVSCAQRFASHPAQFAEPTPCPQGTSPDCEECGSMVVRAHRDAVVIGAGAAGLAVARSLQSAGLGVRVLESSQCAGASWWQRYEGLRLNTVRWLSDLPLTRMGAEFGRWPDRKDWAAYLSRYAEQLDCVDLGVTASRLERSGQVWNVHTDSGVLSARHVVVATGHDRVPVIPDWHGAEHFGGRLMHSAEFRDAKELAGSRVLVVGTGNSGVEIATLLAADDSIRVCISMRTAPAAVEARTGPPSDYSTGRIRPPATRFRRRLVWAHVASQDVVRPCSVRNGNNDEASLDDEAYVLLAAP